LRAAMIIGAGSASFEILRYLVERLPVMVTPSWVKTESQPVAIADVLHWLVRCLDVPETTGKTLEIGGPHVLPYRDLMQIMAEELHLPKRWIFPLPFLTPRLSSLWISLVTPVSYRIARPLGEGLRNRVVVTNGDTQRLMPHQPLSVREAIRQALRQVESNDVETRWSAAGPVPGDPQWAGGTVFTDQRSVWIKSDPRAVFAAVCRIGGGNGWYAGDILWRIRGWMDTLVGGPGLRRGRRDSERVEYGEALDFWRVVGIDRDRSLSLLAEMKLPGVAMLKFDLEPEPDGGRTKLTMTARFRPKGLFGILYWYAVLPLHSIVFGGMLNGIRDLAEATWRSENPETPAPTPTAAVTPGYGRARLWLGISAVGTVVTLSTLGLALDAPGTIQQILDPGVWGQVVGLLMFVLIYAAVQFPFDLAGGYLLPKSYGRNHPPLGSCLAGLARGVAVHASVFFLAAVALLIAGRYGGVAATVAAGLAMSLLLLIGRVGLAGLMAPLGLIPGEPTASPSSDSLPIALAQSQDEGFTGGVVGVFRPRFHLLPTRWREALGPEGFEVATQRRSLAVKTGSWWRGRAVALLFTLAGLALCAWMVGTARLGTAGGTIAFSLWFSLWSFAGLLTLPTLSRRGVIEVDERARAEGRSSESLRTATRLLDDLQDGEPVRPALVEAFFHPIPSVQTRLDGPRAHDAVGFWDAARTAVYLSLAGVGLLGRAVHCNCGRPSLWVFLPTD
ncbi:MAG: SDR family oxidoreductase, partial [Gemmataceae bacterium]